MICGSLFFRPLTTKLLHSTLKSIFFTDFFPFAQIAEPNSREFLWYKRRRAVVLV